MFLALHTQNAHHASYMVFPIVGRDYKVQNVVLCRLSTDGSYLINKHRSQKVNLVSMSRYDHVTSICTHGAEPSGSTRAREIYT